MDPPLRRISYQDRLGLVQEEDLVLWRNTAGQECKGTVEQREAGKNVGLRQVSRDPNPEFRNDSSDTLKAKRKKGKKKEKIAWRS